MDSSHTQASPATPRKPRIAAFGLFYAGKSSLLNMLADSVSKEIFSTCELGADFACQEHETSHYVLADAPNLDMLDENGLPIAPNFQGIDVPILVHAPGPLEPEELNWLAQVGRAYGHQVNQRLVVVMTHRDKSHNGSAEIQEIECMAELQQQFGLQPLCFNVSNSFYAKGRKEERHDLVLASNLPALRQHLRNLTAQIARDPSFAPPTGMPAGTPARGSAQPSFSGYTPEATS